MSTLQDLHHHPDDIEEYFKRRPQEVSKIDRDYLNRYPHAMVTFYRYLSPKLMKEVWGNFDRCARGKCIRMPGFSKLIVEFLALCDGQSSGAVWQILDAHRLTSKCLNMLLKIWHATLYPHTITSYLCRHRNVEWDQDAKETIEKIFRETECGQGRVCKYTVQLEEWVIEVIDNSIRRDPVELRNKVQSLTIRANEDLAAYNKLANDNAAQEHAIKLFQDELRRLKNENAELKKQLDTVQKITDLV